MPEENSAAAPGKPHAASTPDASEPARGLGNVVSSFVLSYGLGIFLLAALVYTGGVWSIASQTRVLDLAIEGGIVRYHDHNLGLVDGVTDQQYYLYSQDAIDYRLVLIAALVYFVYWALKGVQYHGIARFAGLKGSAGQHIRAWLYGSGMGRLLPLRFGESATRTMLLKQGEDAKLVDTTFGVMSFLVIVFEILVFWIWGLFVTDYPTWFNQSIAALIICAAGYLLARRTGLIEWGPEGFFAFNRKILRSLANQPATFARLGGLSILLMLFDDLTPFILAMAFTGSYVVLQVSFFIIQSGVVAGYIAKRFPLTPHGIGQWEWGFTLALYFSGIGFPEAASIALLDSAMRHSTGFIVFLIVLWTDKSGTSFGEALNAYMRGEPPKGTVVEPLEIPAQIIAGAHVAAIEAPEGAAS